MLKRFINSFLAIFTLSSVTPAYVYAHNLPDDHIETAIMHPFVSPDHAISLIVVGALAIGVAYLLKKRSSH